MWGTEFYSTNLAADICLPKMVADLLLGREGKGREGKGREENRTEEDRTEQNREPGPRRRSYRYKGLIIKKGVKKEVQCV